MIRFLLHFAGDVHQPLHAIQLFDSRFRDGDAGGNGFYVYVNNSRWNLHSLWDQGGLKYRSSYQRPLTDASKAILTSKAQALMQEFPYDYFGERLITSRNFTQWQQESYHLAIDYAYLNHNLQFDEPVTEDYISDAQDITSKQITLAGYRLGSLLNQILAPETEEMVCRQNVPDPSLFIYSIEMFSVIIILTCMGGFLLGASVVVFCRSGFQKDSQKKEFLIGDDRKECSVARSWWLIGKIFI